MKTKLLTVAVLAGVASQVSAEILYDSFNYPTGPLTSIQTIAGGAVTAFTGQTNPYGPQWFPLGTNVTTAASANFQVISPGLTIPGIYDEGDANGGTTNAVSLNTSVNSSRIGVGPFGLYQNQDTSAPDVSVFYSLALTVNDITALATGGAFIAGFNTVNAPQNSSPSVAAPRIYFRRLGATTTFEIGTSKGADITWDTTDIYDSTVPSQTTFFIVGEYLIHGGYADQDDTSSLWVNPSSSNFGALTAPSPTLTTSLDGDLSTGQINTFVLRAAGVAKPAAYTVDEVRVDTTWAGVTPPPGTTWSGTTGSWSDTSHWSTGSVPSGAGQFVNLLGTTATSVTIDSPQTTGTLNLDNAAGYTIGGTSPLTLDGSSSINVAAGSHTISAPLILNGDTNITVATGDTLSISNLTVASGAILRKDGYGGLTLTNLRADNVFLLGGVTKITPSDTTGSVSIIKNLNLPAYIQGNPTPPTNAATPPKGTLDLTNNSLILDYTGTSPLLTASLNNNSSAAAINGTAILYLIHMGYNGGAWTGTGITSSTAAAEYTAATTASRQPMYGLGYAEASSLLGLSGSSTGTWAGQTVDATSILVKMTYLGDFNLDGKIDADDYANIDRTLATGGISNGTAVWMQGDFNYDGNVNSSDLLIMDAVFAEQTGVLSPDLLALRQAEYGSAYVSALIASVPEPASMALLVFPALAMISRRRKA